MVDSVVLGVVEASDNQQLAHVSVVRPLGDSRVVDIVLGLVLELVDELVVVEGIVADTILVDELELLVVAEDWVVEVLAAAVVEAVAYTVEEEVVVERGVLMLVVVVHGYAMEVSLTTSCHGYALTLGS